MTKCKLTSDGNHKLVFVEHMHGVDVWQCINSCCGEFIYQYHEGDR